MRELRYTLLSDGSSDEALLPILTWILRAYLPNRPIDPQWADLRHLRQPPRGLPERIEASVRLYPCDLLFVHRDAEHAPRETRCMEIHTAIEATRQRRQIPPHIPVVPVRMSEAWLLFDERAIRRAAGNPNGCKPLPLPSIAELEGLPNPKALLNDLLCMASGLHGRHLKRFSESRAIFRIADFARDFTPLRALPAFQALESDVRQTVICLIH
jgi:hypothetical protein